MFKKNITPKIPNKNDDFIIGMQYLRKSLNYQGFY